MISIPRSRFSSVFRIDAPLLVEDYRPRRAEPRDFGQPADPGGNLGPQRLKLVDAPGAQVLIDLGRDGLPHVGYPLQDPGIQGGEGIGVTGDGAGGPLIRPDTERIATGDGHQIGVLREQGSDLVVSPHDSLPPVAPPA